MSDHCDGCADLAQRLGVIENRLRALGQGLGLIATAAQRATVRVEAVRQGGDIERLRQLRPRAFSAGQQAAREGIPASACPYRESRGGFRNAWLAGHGGARSVTASVPQPIAFKPRPNPTEGRPPAWARGFDAGQAGVQENACPFASHEVRARRDWRDGHAEGVKARRTSRVG